jgi:hypothetical protein
MPKPAREREPWEILPGETAQQYAAFCAYRDLPARSRSINRLASDGVARVDRLKVWSPKFHWVERVRAWQVYVDERLRERYVEERLEAVSEIASTSAALRGVLTLPARALLAEINDRGADAVLADLRAMHPAQLLALTSRLTPALNMITQLEMQMRGLQLARPDAEPPLALPMTEEDVQLGLARLERVSEILLGAE